MHIYKMLCHLLTCGSLYYELLCRLAWNGLRIGNGKEKNLNKQWL